MLWWAQGGAGTPPRELGGVGWGDVKMVGESVPPAEDQLHKDTERLPERAQEE